MGLKGAPPPKPNFPQEKVKFTLYEFDEENFKYMEKETLEGERVVQSEEGYYYHDKATFTVAKNRHYMVNATFPDGKTIYRTIVFTDNTYNNIVFYRNSLLAKPYVTAQ